MVTFTLVRNTPLGQTLTVDISSNAASRLQLPASVSFAAEEETLQFTGNAIDNSDFDGDATATITAALTSFAASADVTIINDDPNPFPWHNLVDGLDVNDDTRVTSLDALVVLNFLNREGVGPLSSPRTGPFIDTNRDNVGSPIDALIIINFLNRQPGNGGEGEADSDAESSSIVRATDMALADFMQQEEKRRRDLRLS